MSPALGTIHSVEGPQISAQLIEIHVPHTFTAPCTCIKYNSIHCNVIISLFVLPPRKDYKFFEGNDYTEEYSLLTQKNIWHDYETNDCKEVISLP